MTIEEQKWRTVLTHRSYPIQINEIPDPRAPHGFGYRINDPVFSPDYERYVTVEDAIKAIDEEKNE